MLQAPTKAPSQAPTIAPTSPPLADFSYVANINAATVSKCSINTTTAMLYNCSTGATGFNQPYGVSVLNGYLYVVGLDPLWKVGVRASDI